MKQVKGQISVFLALASLAIFGLIAGCLEGGRAALIDYFTKQAAQSAVESVFAAYQGEVKRSYGLLMARGAEGGSISWPEQAEAYLEKYLAPGAGTRYGAADRIRLQDLQTQALSTVWITDGSGRVFTEAVTDYMKSAGLSLLLKEFLGRLGLYSEEEGLSFVGSLKEMVGDEEKSPDSLLENYENMKEEAIKLQELAAQPVDEPAPGTPPPEVPKPTELKSDLLEQIKAIRENGLIAVITGSTPLSRYSWNDPSLPSRLSASEKAGNSWYSQGSTGLIDHFLLGEYLLAKMGNYTDLPEEGPQYEAEYVISGRDTDKASFEAVVGWILLIRMGFNMAYLVTDPDKLAQAEALALAIMSILALPQLVTVLKWLLVAAWALAESIVDVKTLLAGKKEPLIKSAATWQLNALSLDLGAGNGSQRGFGYEDYLRLLFYLGRPEDQAYRMMDVIQQRIRLKEPGFLMKEYMVYGELSVTADAAYLYIQVPVLRLLSEPGSGRKYTKRASYAYERR